MLLWFNLEVFESFMMILEVVESFMKFGNKH